MSDVIGRGVIEVSADSSRLTAGINTAKKSLEDLGVTSSKVTKQQSASIDRYVKNLSIAAVTTGKASDEATLYALALRGANEQQLASANAALKLAAANTKVSSTLVIAGQSAKQTASVLRGVPAQFTDIVTSLQGGQAPLTVLLQQGGQLKDMFGGVGNAAKALGGYIAGLVNPYTIAAAAAAGLAVAYEAGAKESREFNKALVLTGGYAGTTIGQMQQMAERIDDIAGTQGAASEALVAIAASGKIAGDSMQRVAEAAILMNRATGKPIEDTVKEFASLANDPVKAALKLNETYHFLTVAVYEQIAALAAQGKEQEAVKLAQDKFAEANIGMASEITARLGLLERAWRGVKDAIFETWDAAKNIGREITPEKELAQLLKLQKIRQDMEARDPAMKGRDVSASFTDARIKELQAQVAAAQKAAKDKTVQQEAVSAAARLDAFNKEYASPKEKKEKELAKVAADFDKLVAAGQVVTAQQRAAAVAKIEEKYKPKPGAASQIAKSQLAADLETIKAASDAQIAVYASAERILDAQRAAGLVSEREAFQAKAALIKANDAAREAALEKELARLQREKLSGAAKIDNDKKITETQAKLTKAQADSATNLQVIAIQEEAANRKIAQSYNEAVDAAIAYVEAVKRQTDRSVAGIGAGEDARAELEAFGAMQEKLIAARQKLDTQLERKEIDADQYSRYLTLAQAAYSAEADAYIESRDRIKAAQADWSNGASEAWENYKTKAQNVAAQSEAAFTGAFDGLTSGLASSASQAIVYGKSLEDSMKSVALSVADAFISAFAKIAIQQLVLNAATQSAYAGSVALEAQAQVAMAGLNAFASTAAIPIVGPLAAPGAAAAAIAAAEPMAAAASAAAAASIVGAREIGGPVGAGGLYRINEKRPEVLSQDGKDYLLMGNKGGLIRPNTDPAANLSGRAPAGESPVTIINQTTGRVDNVVEQRLSNGERAIIIQETTKAVASQIANPNSPVSRSLGASFNMQRARG